MLVNPDFVNLTSPQPSNHSPTTATNMSDDDSSELSSVPSEDESLQLKKKDGILKFFKKAPRKEAPPKIEASPPRPKRAPSPPHEYVLADNSDIAFIVMFRSRFTEAFPKSLSHFGPQELERDIVETVPGEHVEHFLCALLGLLLNRKQDVKSGHYNRALEEAISTHKTQWARDWETKNPLSGGKTFASMIPTERLTLLRTLILWSLSSSDAIKGIIQASYKQNRHEDDLNQPLSVQPWGGDRDKRRYYLIEGLDDTHFRVYRESNHSGLDRTWWSVASDIDELKTLAEKLIAEDGGQKARVLSVKILAAIPRFEATEEKRKRREYRQFRKQQFKRPEPNYSMYEGRTRGKRMKYTYSDGEDDDEGYSDATSNRRSTRNTRVHSPAEDAGPTITQSGRQIKAPQTGLYGESLLSGARAPSASVDGSDRARGDSETSTGGRPRRAAASVVNQAPKGGRNISGYNKVDEMTSDEEGDASEQDYGDEEEDDNISLASDVNDQDDLTDNDEEMEDSVAEVGEKKSLIIKLMVKKPEPESKRAIKLRLTEMQPDSRPPESTTNDATQNGNTNNGEANGTVSLGNHPQTNSLGGGSKPMDIVPKSPLPPTSPLAFRQSPEKAHTYSPAIGIYGGAL